MCACHSIEDGRYDAGFMITSQHQIHAISIDDFLWFQLGITACHNHEGTRVLFHQSMDGLSAFMVSHLRHAARVNHHQICHFVLRRLSHPIAHQLLCHCARFSEVEFASQREKSRLLTLQYARINHVSSKFVAKVGKKIVSLHHQNKLFTHLSITKT